MNRHDKLLGAMGTKDKMFLGSFNDFQIMRRDHET